MVQKLKSSKKISHKKALKEAEEQWDEMTDQEKKPYLKMEEKDQKRYDK